LDDEEVEEPDKKGKEGEKDQFRRLAEIREEIIEEYREEEMQLTSSPS